MRRTGDVVKHYIEMVDDGLPYEEVQEVLDNYDVQEIKNAVSALGTSCKALSAYAAEREARQEGVIREVDEDGSQCNPGS